MYGQVNIVIQLCIVLVKTTLGTELPLCNPELDILHDKCCLVRCMNAKVYNNTECNEKCPSHMFEIDSNYCNISTVTCITNCPEGYYGLQANNTKVCVDCRLLCQAPYFKTVCSCRNQYSDTNDCADKDVLIALKVVTGVLSIILVLVISAFLRLYYKRSKDDKKGIRYLTKRGNDSQPAGKDLAEDVNRVAYEQDMSYEDNNRGQTRNKNDPRYAKFGFGTKPVQSRDKKNTPDKQESDEYVNAEIIREHKKTLIDRISQTFNLKRKSTNCSKIPMVVDNIKCSQNNDIKSTDIEISEENTIGKTNKISGRSNPVLKSNDHVGTIHLSVESNIESKRQNTSTPSNITNGKDIPIGATTRQLPPTSAQDIHNNQAEKPKETLDGCSKNNEYIASKLNHEDIDENKTNPYENFSSKARCKNETVGNEQGNRLSVGSISNKSSLSSDSDHSSYHSARESLTAENKENVLDKIEESSCYANVISGSLNNNGETETMSELKSNPSAFGVTHMAGLNISNANVTVNIINSK